MAWIYEQSTGKLFNPFGALVGTGYSGGGIDPHNLETIKGKNNPAMQDVHKVGPIPCGTYTICAPVNSHTHGEYAMGLTPDVGNETFGRDHFLMHGDSIPHPGFASEGCIIQSHAIRVKVWESGDHRLEVVATMNPQEEIAA
jgi:hypothetical protein